MSDLVKLLRSDFINEEALARPGFVIESYIKERRRAADRIEALEAALREAYRHIDECCPHRIPNDTRAALGEKKDA